MKIRTILLTLFITVNVSGSPGTRSTDDTLASQAEASLSGFRKSGFTDDGVQLQEEDLRPEEQMEKEEPCPEDKRLKEKE